MNIVRVLIVVVLGLATLVNSIEDTTNNEDHQASFVVSKNDEHHGETRELDVSVARQLSKSGKGKKSYHWNSSSSSSSSSSKSAKRKSWKNSSSRDKWNWKWNYWKSSRSYKWKSSRSYKWGKWYGGGKRWKRKRRRRHYPIFH